MADSTSQTPNPIPSPGGQVDPLAALHKMSTTAGVGSGDYVAINPLAVASVIVGVASLLLAPLNNILLIIPAVGGAFAFIAFRQIINSNGTQAGKVLTILGLILSIGISTYVLGNQAIELSQYRKDSGEISAVIEKLGGFVKTGNYDAAYGMFTPKFKERISKEAFTLRLKQAQQSSLYGRIQGFRSNQRMNILLEPTLKIRVAVGLVLVDWEKVPQYPGREEMRFENLDGTWQVHDIPTFFPPPEQNGMPPTQAPAG